MNRLLTIFGVIFTILWGLVAVVSVGLPVQWCQAIDKGTFYLFSSEVFKMAHGFYFEADNHNMPTMAFLFIFGAIFSLYMMLITKVARKRPQKFSLGVIILFAILMRLILLPSQPIHENDFYRYLWDGKSVNHQINPYKYAPSDILMYDYGIKEDFYDEYQDVTLKARVVTWQEEEDLKVLTALRDHNAVIYDRIGHWQVPTVYPPVAQGLFALSTWVAVDSYIGMKFMFMLFDIGVILLIIALLKHIKFNPCMSVVYAWSPLVLKEFPNSGHYDPIAIFFTMLSIYCLLKGRGSIAMGGLALGVLAKFFSGVLTPLYLKYTKKSSLLILLGVVSACYLPFLFWGDSSWREIFQGLNVYNQHWSYNSSIFALIYVFVGHISPALSESLLPAKVLAGLIYTGVLIVLYQKMENHPVDILHKCFLAMATLFIINPVGDPWYFCWTIPFLCFFPHRSWLLLSGLLMLSYLNFQPDLAIVNTRILSIPVMNWIIYIPFFICLIMENWKKISFCKNFELEKEKSAVMEASFF